MNKKVEKKNTGLKIIKEKKEDYINRNKVINNKFIRENAIIQDKLK